MRPQMETIGPFTVLGVSHTVHRGSETSELFAGIWKTFESHKDSIQPLATAKVYYGVTFSTADPDVTEYLAGMQVPVGTPSVAGLEARSVPGGQYAVFECSVDSIGPTYQHVFGTWSPTAAAQFEEGRPSFEQFPDNTTEEPVRLHIPVRQR
jgi:predicted transcriptional regulator YdeE